MKIVFDGGHYPETPGKRCPDDSMRESHFNFPVADILCENFLTYEGVEIKKTYEISRDVPLQERTDAANNWNADLFFSIHANAAGNGGWHEAHGIETYVYTSKPEEAFALAAEVQGCLIRETGRYNRGVKTADFHVLRETKMTAVLVECGFMTNREEAELLKSEAYRQKCAKAIETAIVKVYGLKKKAPKQTVGTPIIGGATATVEQAQEWARKRGASETFISLAPIFWTLADKHGGVNPAIAFAQSAKETGFGNFGGVIDETYNNPCGMKTSGGGGNYDPKAHMRFRDWYEGISAHLDHLAIYAGADGYPRIETADPRHFPYIKGKAKTVEQLGGNWAPAADYGRSIIENYLKDLEQTQPPEKQRTAVEIISNIESELSALKNLLEGVK